MNIRDTRSSRHAAMTLTEEADRAIKVRNALTIFTAPCSKYAEDIERSISTLSSLSLTLREADQLIAEDSGKGLDAIRDDLEIVHSHITFSLGDAWKCIGTIGRGLTPKDYCRTWKHITSCSKIACGKSFHNALHEYHVILEGLVLVLKSFAILNQSSKSGGDLRQSRTPTSPSKNAFIAPLEHGLDRLSIGRPHKQKSYERERGTRPMSPAGSSKSSHIELSGHDTSYPLSPPMSPAVTASTISRISSNAPSIPTTSTHWAKDVYRNATATVLPPMSEGSRYHEPKRKVKEHLMPDERYEVVAHHSFPEGLRLNLFYRPTDRRAKVVCYYRDHTGCPEYSCLPLDDLHLRRSKSILRICRRGRSNEPENWVSIKFSTAEKLILFANMFIAMRSQDDSEEKRRTAIDDEELRDEVCEYAGKIVDQGAYYALRVFYDKITGLVRVQVSEIGGERDRMPVWTSFVTQSILEPAWKRRITDRSTVMLSKLKMHVFSSHYEPKQTSTGASLLHFETRQDALDFSDVIDSLRTQRVEH